MEYVRAVFDPQRAGAAPRARATSDAALARMGGDRRCPPASEASPAPSNYAAADLAGPQRRPRPPGRSPIATRSSVALNALPKARARALADVARSATALADKVQARSRSRSTMLSRQDVTSSREQLEREITRARERGEPARARQRGSRAPARVPQAAASRARRCGEAKDTLSAKLETCALALQNMRFDLMRLARARRCTSTSRRSPNQALNLAENVDEALYVADEMGRVGGASQPGRARASRARVTDHLLDRLVAAVGTQYLVDAEIGRGGMAVVYRATDLRLNRRVAIKVLPPELAFNADVRERFLREAQTSAQLAHPAHRADLHGGRARGDRLLRHGARGWRESRASGSRASRGCPIDDARRILARRGRRARVRARARRGPSRREAGQHHARARRRAAPW